MPFHPAHLDLLAWRDFDRDYTRNLPTFIDQVEAFCSTSLAVTAMIDGRITACGGILDLGSGIGYAWMFGSIYLKQHAIIFIKELRGWMEATATVGNFHRLQTVCHEDDDQGKKWVEALGFIAEGTLRSYDAIKGNYIMYAITK